MSDAVPRKRSRPTPALFYGYPPELIARWCSVSRGTAYLWKIGQRNPSDQAVRLFVLHRDRRVLTDEWKGWLVKPDGLVDPEGNETSRNLLRGYFLMMQWAHSIAAELGRSTEYWRRLGAVGESERAAGGPRAPGARKARRTSGELHLVGRVRR